MAKHWGKGYATEAGRTCLDLGFGRFGITAIIGRTAQANLGSIRVLEKLGLRYWKTEEALHDPCALFFRIERDAYERSTRSWNAR
jgi:ribosomal-protein-alanine N-acetyltransferase